MNKQTTISSIDKENFYWENWIQSVGNGIREKLDKRIKWDNLPNKIINHFDFPANSIHSFEEIKRLSVFIRNEFPDINKENLENPSLSTESSLPFKEFLTAIIYYARQEIIKLLNKEGKDVIHYPFVKLLSYSAYTQLEQGLREQIFRITSQCLYHEFSNFRPVGIELLTRISEGKTPKGKSENKYYNEFIEKNLQDGFNSFFQKYPVLSQYLHSAIKQWINNTLEFLQRLDCDYKMILISFCRGKKIQDVKITGIQTNLSDAHNGGKTVYILTTSTGVKFLYKPRSLEIDVAWSKFQHWCNQRKIFKPFQTINVINRTGYGWVEYIKHKECTKEEELKRYYERIGIMLCSLYVLKGTDLHFENIIAHGEFPQIIDLETLFHQEPNPIKNSLHEITAKAYSYHFFLNSVLRIGLLPFWQIYTDKHIAYDSTGLGNYETQKTGWKRPVFMNMNTDNMYCVNKSITISLDKNIPVLNGKVCPAIYYVPDIINGFRQMYCFLIDNKETILKKNGPLTFFKYIKTRFVFRDTIIYAIIKNNTFCTDLSKDSILSTIELEKLSRIFLMSNKKPKDWFIFHAELDAMKNMDVPKFECDVSNRHLYYKRKPIIKNYFKSTSYESVVTQIKLLCEKDMNLQSEIIRGSFFARTIDAESANKTTLMTTEERHKYYGRPSHKDYIARAKNIGEQIIRSSIINDKKQINWIGLGFIPTVERYQYRPLSFDLYDGVCGIAVFMGALYKITGNMRYKGIALKSLHNLRRIIYEYSSSNLRLFALENGIGGFSGIGSMIYSFVKISEFIGETSLINDANKISELFSEDIIKSDKQLDILSGTAGALAGLVCLHKHTQDISLIKKIHLCGNHLLEKRDIMGKSATNAWKTFWDKPLTGFSHGASGISYSLMQAYKSTGKKEYLESAKAGILYERKTFSEAEMNWPDFTLSSNDTVQFRKTWCHGAPGIVLSRLFMLPIYRDDEMMREIKIGITTTKLQGLRELDHLCCGNFGCNEILLRSAQLLNDKKLLKKTYNIANDVIARADTKGYYTLFIDVKENAFNPSFFRGLSGIGYHLLRLASPNDLPCVMALE